MQDRPRLAAEDQVLAGSRPCPPGEQIGDELRRLRLPGPSRAHQIDGVLKDMIGHDHLPHQFLHLQNRRPVEDRLHVAAGRLVVALHDLHLLRTVRIADDDVEHEAIELRFRQRIGAFLLDRVLRRQHEERFG